MDNEAFESSDRTDRPSRIPWPPIILIGAIIAAIVLSNLYPISWPGLNDLPARIIGIAVGAGGILLAAWSIWSLHRAKTTVMPHLGSDNLVTTGPYTRFRNPIYIADVMMMLGVAELTKNVWFVVAAAVFILLVTFLAIIPEERHLEARFGDAYRDYKARSRRWL
jgi:protein-S-isoprenylcysteine O-methyltransferase Ste14